jgi:uncharacterized membrane protein
MTPVAAGLVGVVVHLSIVVWVFMDANIRKAGGCQWALLVLCFPGVALIAYAFATGSRTAWLMVLVLVVVSAISVAGVMGTMGTAGAKAVPSSPDNQPGFDPFNPPPLPPPPSPSLQP